MTVFTRDFHAVGLKQNTDHLHLLLSVCLLTDCKLTKVSHHTTLYQSTSTIKNTQGTPNSLGKDPYPAHIKQLNSLFKHVNTAILKLFSRKYVVLPLYSI